MKKFFILVLSLLLTSVKSYCQVEFFIQGDLNYLFLSTVEKSSISQHIITDNHGVAVIDTSYTVKQKYDPEPGFDILLGIQKDIRPNLRITSGIGFSLISYSKKTTEIIHTGMAYFEIDEFGNPMDMPGSERTSDATLNSTFKKRSNFAFLQIPLNLNYMILENRLAVGAGISPMILLLSRQMKAEAVYASGGDPQPNQPKLVVAMNVIEDKSNDGLNQILWNGDFMLRYRVVGNAWANLTFQYMFSPLHEKDEDFRSKGESAVLKLGIRYYL